MQTLCHALPHFPHLPVRREQASWHTPVVVWGFARLPFCCLVARGALLGILVAAVTSSSKKASFPLGRVVQSNVQSLSHALPHILPWPFRQEQASCHTPMGFWRVARLLCCFLVAVGALLGILVAAAGNPNLPLKAPGLCSNLPWNRPTPDRPAVPRQIRT